MAGEASLRIQRDEAVREECDFDGYLTCIDWCAEAGVETIHDLGGRVVEPETFVECWVDRCRRIAE